MSCMRILVIGATLICLAAYEGYDEYRFIEAKETSGVVSSINRDQRSGRYGKKFSVRVCQFQYEDGDEMKFGKSDIVDSEFDHLNDGKPVPIEYVPGTNTSRVQGSNGRSVKVMYFCGALGLILVAIGVAMFWSQRKAHATT